MNEWNCFGITCCVTRKVHHLCMLSAVSGHALVHGFSDAAKKIVLFRCSFAVSPHFLAYVNYLPPSKLPAKAKFISFSTYCPEQKSALHLTSYLFPPKIIAYTPIYLNRLDAPLRAQCVFHEDFSFNMCNFNHNLLCIALTCFPY